MKAERQRLISRRAVNGCLDDIRWLQSEIACSDNAEFPKFNDAIPGPGIDPQGASPGLMTAGSLRAGDEELGIRRPCRVGYAVSVLMVLRALIAPQQHSMPRGELESNLGFTRRIGGHDRPHGKIRGGVGFRRLARQRYSAGEQDGGDQPGVHRVQT
jgi:hypothetical protein